MLEIITPAQSKALTTLSAVAAELDDAGSHEPLLAEFILRASATVETIVDRSFALERVRQTVEGTWDGPIFAERYPVISVVSLAVNGVAADPASVQVGLGGILYRRAGWGRDVSIVYDAGYVLPGEEGRTLPHDIEQIVIDLVKDAYRSHGRDQALRSFDVNEAFTESYFSPGVARAAIIAQLSAYRSPVVA